MSTIAVPAQTSKSQLDIRGAVSAAFDHRPSIGAARERLQAALANQSALSALGATRLEFGYETRPDLGVGQDLLLAQPIDISGKTRAARDSGRAGVVSARAELRQAELDLQSETLNAFSDAFSAQELVRTGRDLLELAQRSYDATQSRINAGDLPPAQLLRADLDLRQAKQTLQMRLRGWESARVRLAAAIGSDPASIKSLDGRIPSAPEALNASGRADLQTIRSDIDSSHADAAAALSSRWPDLELQVARDYWDLGGQFVGRVQFVWPVNDFGASRERLRQARANQRAAQDSLRDRVEQARREVEAARLDYLAAQKSSQDFDALAEDAKSLLSKEQGAFAAGASTLLDVLDATRALRDIEESAAAARAQWIQAEAKLLSATGTLLTERP
jgi:cobalt-zinc-cadmium efflux system outer membrane protein